MSLPLMEIPAEIVETVLLLAVKLKLSSKKVGNSKLLLPHYRIVLLNQTLLNLLQPKLTETELSYIGKELQELI